MDLRALASSLVIVAAPACGGSSTPPPTAGPPPAATAPAPDAPPCFPDGPPLVATAMYEQLQKYAESMYDPPEAAKPKGAYGTCTVEGNQVHAADGSLVAELTCGVRVLRRGIVDDLGLQIGARGQDVLDRKAKPVPELSCWANGPTQVGCRFARPDDSDTDSTWYVVDGQLTADTIVGDAAVAFFAPRPLVELEVSIWCH